MQAVAFTKITTQAPASAGPASSGAADAAAAEGLDFAALLAAQFQGGGEAGVEMPLQADAEATDDLDFAARLAAQFQGSVGAGDEVPLRADTNPALQVPSSIDSTLQAMALAQGLVPGTQAMQQAASEIKPSLSTSSSDKLSGESRISMFPGLVNDGEASSKDKTSLLAKEGAAEFAVNGKSLPSGDWEAAGAKVVDTFKLPALAVDAPRPPEALSAVSAIMSAGQSQAVSEIKLPIGSLQPPVGASGWGDALGQKVVWMAGQHQQVAELHLNPPNLGPMEVRLTISNDQVTAQFVSHQPAVREAIEAAMPRLREMFADSGMTLGNASVGSDSLPQRQNSGQERQSGAESHPDFPLVDGYAMPVTSRGIMHLPGDGRGVVDLFA